jgi:hypothetical protein
MDNIQGVSGRTIRKIRHVHRGSRAQSLAPPNEKTFRAPQGRDVDQGLSTQSLCARPALASVF